MTNTLIIFFSGGFAAIISFFFIGMYLGKSVVKSGSSTLQSIKDSIETKKLEIENLRNEKSETIKDGLVAQDKIDQWNKVKKDHANLEQLRAELDEFESEENNRIDQLERKRSELALQLSALQQALTTHPAEAFLRDEEWEEKLKTRKEEIDDLQVKFDETKSNLEKTLSDLNKTRNKQEELEEKLKKLEEEIVDKTIKRDSIEITENATISFPTDPVSVKIENPTIHSGINIIEKLGSFRTLPDCLKGIENPKENANENELLEEFDKALRECGLIYHERIIRAFHTALKVNDLSPLTVLSGLSGTGKSQLPKAYAHFFGIHFLHVPVEPGWDSPQDLLGFYDFVSERYRPSDRARALGHFDKGFGETIKIDQPEAYSGKMLMILLDEMNLARTEYYFSEFLSRLEMRGPRKPNSDESNVESRIAIDLPYSQDDKPIYLRIPYNVLWVGTLNEDETTQALSDKVLDRANSIRFATPPAQALIENTAPLKSIPVSADHLKYSDWLSWGEQPDDPQKKETDSIIKELAEIMKEAKRGVGYRIVQSINAYIKCYPSDDWQKPMIDQINMRLLPKLAGVELRECQNSLDKLKKISIDKLNDEKFEEALDRAMRDSQENQIFTWLGYTYE